jgi:crossover junction endodeoxyribonuclease RuvC
MLLSDSTVPPFRNVPDHRGRSTVPPFHPPYRVERGMWNALSTWNAHQPSDEITDHQTRTTQASGIVSAGAARGCVISCDPSLTGCAFATSDGIDLTERELTSKPAKHISGTLARFRELADPIVAEAATKRPRLFVVEGQSFGSKGGAAFDRAGFRWMLYDRIAPHVGQIVEVPPTTLKKHAAGKGSADKAAVASALAHRYSRSFASDNQADAFGLLQIGLQLLGLRDPANQAQRDVLATVRKGLLL